MKTRYKFIHFEKSEELDGYFCKNNKSRDVLGFVNYYTSWHTYVFEGIDGCVFNISCLQDICHFMGQIQDNPKGGK